MNGWQPYRPLHLYLSLRLLHFMSHVQLKKTVATAVPATHLGHKQAPDNIKCNAASSIANDFDITDVHTCQGAVGRARSVLVAADCHSSQGHLTNMTYATSWACESHRCHRQQQAWHTEMLAAEGHIATGRGQIWLQIDVSLTLSTPS